MIEHFCILNVSSQFSAKVASLFKSSCSIRRSDGSSCSYSTEHKKEVHYTLVHNTLVHNTLVHNTLVHNTTITAVRNIHNGAQHIHDTETFRLSEHQVASTMISVLAGRGGGKGHEETLC